MAGALGEAALQHLERSEFPSRADYLVTPIYHPGGSFWVLFGVVESRPLEIWE